HRFVHFRLGLESNGQSLSWWNLDARRGDASRPNWKSYPGTPIVVEFVCFLIAVGVRSALLRRRASYGTPGATSRRKCPCDSRSDSFRRGCALGGFGEALT